MRNAVPVCLWHQHVPPAGGAVHVTRAQGAPLQIAELVDPSTPLPLGATRFLVIVSLRINLMANAFDT